MIAADCKHNTSILAGAKGQRRTPGDKFKYYGVTNLSADGGFKRALRHLRIDSRTLKTGPFTLPSFLQTYKYT